MDTSELLVFEVHEPNPKLCEVVKIDTEAAKLIRQVQIETGYSAKTIASYMIKFAAKNYIVKKV